MLMQGETSTETLKRPRDSDGSGPYKEVLTNTKITIFREIHPEDKLTEDDKISILEEQRKMLCRTPIGELPHLKSYRLGGGTLIYIYIYSLSKSLVNGSSKPLIITDWDEGPGLRLLTSGISTNLSK
jgi:hypothetical protein